MKRNWGFQGRIIAGGAAVVLVIIGVLDAIVGCNLKQSLESRFNAIVQTNLAELNQHVQGALTDADVLMRSNIESRFELPVVQGLMRDVAIEQSKRLLETEVRPSITQFQEDARFLRIQARAQAFDFGAYRELLSVAVQTSENATTAKQVLREVDRRVDAEAAQDRLIKRSYASFSAGHIYGGPFTSDELARALFRIVQDETVYNRQALVTTVAEVRQPIFLSLLIDFLQNEADLGVANRLCSAISDVAGEQFRTRDYEKLQRWWAERRNVTTNYPIHDLERALILYQSIHYSEAVQSFEAVLKVDSGADLSRAHAIACYSELQDTNRVTALLKQFRDPSSRWARWATAKAELEFGSVSNATFQFFSLSTNQPSLPELPVPQHHLFRRIDWLLYTNLTHSRLAP